MTLPAIVAVASLRGCRAAIGLSQSKLSRLSGVSRFKICLYELGDGSLSGQEQDRIRRALQAEKDRLQDLSANVSFEEPKPPTHTAKSKGELVP
jgi:predicted transcriptional regulator